jgi:membrane protease YdiL (CAAX protease family)
MAHSLHGPEAALLTDRGAAPALPEFDRRLALLALATIPVLYLLVLWLSAALSPLLGWTLGLVAYWSVLGGALLRWGDRDWLAEWLTARWPGWLVGLLLVLPVVGLGAVTMRLLGQDPLPAPLIWAVGIGAVVNATLEELFWRGALIPDPTPRSAAASLGLFTLAHAVWLGAVGLETGGPPWAPFAAAIALGGVWTASRLLTGTLGAAVLSHAGFNLFAFATVVALNA